MLQDGMQKEAHRLGQAVRLQWTHDAGRVEAMVKDSAGIILVGPHEQKTLDIVKASGLPSVRLGWMLPLEQADHVGGTDHEAGIAVGDYLFGLGHRDIAFVQGQEGYRGRMERYHGLRESLDMPMRDCMSCALTKMEALSLHCKLFKLPELHQQPCSALTMGWRSPLFPNF